MTARRVVTIVCDKPGCREHYVGGEGQDARAVRAEARRLAGWRTGLRMEVLVDLCRWHS